jgi:hypothetical protein
MKPSTQFQTVNEAMLVMREAFRDQVQVAINRQGDLVYANHHRNNTAPIDLTDPEKTRSVLTAKIENELASSFKSLAELRGHIKEKLPSLREVDFKPDNPAIPVLQCEWEALLSQTDPAKRAEFDHSKKIMARREKLVDFLRNSLPPNGEITPFADNLYEATLTPSQEQQERLLNAYENNAYRSINSTLNITDQQVKDSRRDRDLHMLMPATPDKKRDVVHLKNAAPEQTAAALRELTKQRHTRRTSIAENTPARLPQDQLDSADKNFMQVLSMMSDQTLMVRLGDLQSMLFSSENLLFNSDDEARLRQMMLDNDGNPVMTFSLQKLSRSLIAPDISMDALPLKSPTRGTPVGESNSTFTFRAGVMIKRSDAEQGRLRAQFIGTPELNIRFSLDWQKIDPILAKAWP